MLDIARGHSQVCTTVCRPVPVTIERAADPLRDPFRQGLKLLTGLATEPITSRVLVKAARAAFERRD